MHLLPLALLSLCPVPAGDEVAIAETGLSLTLPELEELEGGLVDRGQMQGRWSGSLDGDRLGIVLWLFPKADFGFVEPEQVAELIRQNQSGYDNAPRFGDFRYLPGDYGYVPYTTLVRAELGDGTSVDAQKWLVSGILPEHGYALEIDLAAVADEDQVEWIESFCEDGLSYEGPLRDPEWTEEEIEARLGEFLPPSLEGERLSDPLRTDHYIVFGNSSGAKAFARQIEEYYDRIQKVFPFDDVEGQRLLPVFLFRTRDQYIEFVAQNTSMDASQAARSAGVASGDWYATTYEDPKDSTHIHELTHQVFGNRLLLRGGGSWLQEGVAVYVETQEYREEANKVKNVGRRVGKDGIAEATENGDFVPFRRFFVMPSLLLSNEGQTQKGNNAAGQAYDQAGAVIRFVMEDKRTREQGFDFIRLVGSQARGDLPATEAAIRRFFGVTLEEFEEMYAEFWKKAR